MIGAEISAFLKILIDFKHASSNSKKTSLAKRFVSGLAMCEKSFIKVAPSDKTPHDQENYGSF